MAVRAYGAGRMLRLSKVTSVSQSLTAKYSWPGSGERLGIGPGQERVAVDGPVDRAVPRG